MLRRKRKVGKKAKTRKGKSSRGRPAIFMPEQKRVLHKMIRGALKEQLRLAARSL